MKNDVKRIVKKDVKESRETPVKNVVLFANPTILRAYFTVLFTGLFTALFTIPFS